jgi:integrase
MPRQAKGISAAKVAKGRPGRYGDGNGLYLTIRSKTSKFWSFRFVRADKMTEMGLGAASGPEAVTLADARQEARKLWEIHKSGRDPLVERRAGRATLAAANAGTGRTFKQAAVEYIEDYRSSWRNAAHVRAWEQTLPDYVYPIIGQMSVDTITTAHVVSVLQPIWTSKVDTASRVRGRIEQVLGREKALGHRSGENPARWKENLKSILPPLKKIKRVRHHAAMPARELGDFMAKLRTDDSVVARALEFCIITCARTSEVLKARWNEIDLEEKLWTVPGEHMKAGREHRVPISARALEILDEMQPLRTGDFVFPGRRQGAGLSAMVLLMKLRGMGYADYAVHGFRSTFRDWVSNSTAFPSEAAELALAHNVGDKTERAYRRGDLLEKRFQLAEKWAEFCAAPSHKTDGKVVSIRSGAK